MIRLLQFPAAIVGTLTVILLVTLSVLGLILFRRTVPDSWLEHAHSAVGEVFFSFAGVLYAVLVGFVVVVVWEQFGDAETATQAEASAVADLLRDTQVFQVADRDGLQRVLLEYTRDVVDDEYVRMRRGEPIEQQSEHLTRVWEAYLKIEPKSHAEIAFYDEAIRKLDDLSSNRMQRIGSSHDDVPNELWVLLFVGGLIIMAFTYIFGMDNFGVQAWGVGLTGALMAAVLYLIFALEHPFVGSISVPPDAYTYILESWSA